MAWAESWTLVKTVWVWDLTNHLWLRVTGLHRPDKTGTTDWRVSVSIAHISWHKKPESFTPGGRAHWLQMFAVFLLERTTLWTHLIPLPNCMGAQGRLRASTHVAVEGWNLWTPKSKTFGIALPHVGRYHSEQEQRLPNPWYSWYSKQVPKLYTLYVYILYIFISILLSLFTPSCPTISRQRKRTEGLLWSVACCGTASQVFFLGRCQRDMCFQRAFVPKRPFLRNCLMELYLSNNVIEELVVTLVSFQRKTTAVCSWDLKWRWDLQLSVSKMIRWTADSISGIFDPNTVFFFWSLFLLPRKRIALNRELECHDCFHADSIGLHSLPAEWVLFESECIICTSSKWVSIQLLKESICICPHCGHQEGFLFLETTLLEHSNIWNCLDWKELRSLFLGVNCGMDCHKCSKCSNVNGVWDPELRL